MTTLTNPLQEQETFHGVPVLLGIETRNLKGAAKATYTRQLKGLEKRGLMPGYMERQTARANALKGWQNLVVHG